MLEIAFNLKKFLSRKSRLWPDDAMDDLWSRDSATCMSMSPAERRCGVERKPRRRVEKPWAEALARLYMVRQEPHNTKGVGKTTWRTKGNMHTQSTRTHWSAYGAIERHSIYRVCDGNRNGTNSKRVHARGGEFPTLLTCFRRNPGYPTGPPRFSSKVVISCDLTACLFIMLEYFLQTWPTGEKKIHSAFKQELGRWSQSLHYKFRIFLHDSSFCEASTTSELSAIFSSIQHHVYSYKDLMQE
jgi:hypothetical protein